MSAVPKAEPVQLPELHSGHGTLDELFTLTMREVQENSVANIRDGAFQYGQELPCPCFETGELWHYVWTRDTAYAVDLGLGWLDPQRSQETLLFKVSEARQKSRFGMGPEIVQDTGSGGSWPISTDRVVWGLGAERLLPLLKDEARENFFLQAYEALKNTLETDRHVVFDPRHGLYRGEQSFLDWREQSYPSWTQSDVRAIAESFALSTNVLHLFALRQASRYAAKRGDAVRRDRYARWAEELAPRIRDFFWLPHVGMFSSMSSATDPAFPLEKFDLLGQSLAVLAGLATPEESLRLFSLYPLHRPGPPVLHPQLPATAIYHNRAVWPFVTAYAIKAAARSGHAPFVSVAMQSLWDGAVRHGSHMENMEFLSGRTHVEDGAYSGPVVNSRRQLWSVAAFVSTILDGILGITAAEDELRFAPRLTHMIAQRWVPGGRMELRDLQWRGKRLHVELRWPNLSGLGDGFLEVERITWNGKVIKGPGLSFAQLAKDNNIRIDLVPGAVVSGLTLNQPEVGPGPALSNDDYKRMFAPMEPRLHWVKDGTLQIEHREINPTRWDLYRNGNLLVSDLTIDTWEVPENGCYTAIQKYEGGGLSSHPSPEMCRTTWTVEWTKANGQLISPDGASEAYDHGRPHFNDWGWPQQVLEVASFEVPHDGPYRLELAFGNAFGPISTGITAAVKWLEVFDPLNGDVQSAPLVMPHQAHWDVWAWSSAAPLDLKAGRAYRLRISDGKNMSYLKHFERYTAGSGGVGGPLNRVNISGVRLRSVE
ncbi:hypothetical protein [Oligoflexus tunisiensis]|uniref:hypothetical protein n=1 Tax=Oligoflexus tunisiensis TaxID=708132 RepID=UPI00114D38A0|nr:hypothetical protein [Oligoflexus tunisiensis]